MGVTVHHRRVSAKLLAEFLHQQDEQRVYDYMYEDYGPFPYTLQHYALGEYWPLLDDFLNSGHDATSPFWRLLHGSRPIIAQYGVSDQEYLTIIDYLSPSEVQVMARSMAEITLERGIQRYMTWRSIPNEALVWAEDPSDYTGYRFVWEQFTNIFCLFRIAEEAGDGILRQWSD